MDKILYFMIKLTFTIILMLNVTQVSCQTLSPVVISCGGAYSEGPGVSLSSTLGEPAHITLQQGSVFLTQGEQQPYDFIRLLNIKVFLEGFYLGSGLMSPVLYTNDPQHFLLQHCDSIVVELRQGTAPYTLMHAREIMLYTNGNAYVQIPPIPQNDFYYIALKHRNSIETWSKVPVVLGPNTIIDFRY